jgi:hypothetical protein
MLCQLAVALVAWLAVMSTVQANYLRDAPVENGLCDSTVKSLSGYYTVIFD